MDVDLSSPILIDGEIATNLFRTNPCRCACQEEWILNHPQEFIKLQTDFQEAGCKVLYTPTFGSSSVRLAQLGREDKLEEYNRKLVQLTREAAKEGVYVAGAMCATGLTLEPHGDSSFTEMMAVYREQAEILLDSGVDLLIVESLSSIAEARAASIALRKFQKPLMITLEVDEDGETPFEGTAINALIMLQELGVSAFGLNCAYGVKNIAQIVSRMKPYAKIPIIAKPSPVNYCEDTKEFVELTPQQMGEQITLVLSAGATIIGGYTGITPKHLKEMHQTMLSYHQPSGVQQEELGDIILADTMQLYNLYCDKIECSPLLTCSIDMTDDLLEVEDESFDVIMIEIDSVEDARDFAQNACIATLPICFSSHNETALKLALLLYQGRAMIDSHTTIDRETLEEIAQKYGAVIY